MRRSVLLLPALLLAATAASGQTADPTRYVAFGDSITEGTGFDEPERTCPEECGYAPRLEDLLQDAGIAATVRNAGLGGETTAEALSRIDTVLTAADDVLLLMEGTNDISRVVTRAEGSLETTLFNLNELAKAALRRGMTTIHATVIPRAPFATKGDTDNQLTAQLNRGIRELAYSRGRALADPFQVFRSTPDLFSELYSPAPDPVGHPNAAGFDLLAEIFFDVITEDDEVPPVPGFVAPEDGAVISPAATLVVRLYDFGAGIDTETAEIVVNGTPVATSRSGDSRRLTLEAAPANPWSGVLRVAYHARDVASPPNEVTQEVAKVVVQGTVLLASDLDRSGRVDGVDLVLFARHFGAAKGHYLYEPAADFNKDDVIDGEDLALLAADFGRSV